MIMIMIIIIVIIIIILTIAILDRDLLVISFMIKLARIQIRSPLKRDKRHHMMLLIHMDLARVEGAEACASLA